MRVRDEQEQPDTFGKQQEPLSTPPSFFSSCPLKGRAQLEKYRSAAKAVTGPEIRVGPLDLHNLAATPTHKTDPPPPVPHFLRILVTQKMELHIDRWSVFFSALQFICHRNYRPLVSDLEIFFFLGLFSANKNFFFTCRWAFYSFFFYFFLFPSS